MSASVAIADPSPLDLPSRSPASRRLAPWLFAWAGVVLLQVLLYAQAFSILPAGDDWTPPLSDINRAKADGVLALVTQNSWAHPMYRPWQSVAFAWLDHLPGNLFTWVHVLDHVSGALAIGVMLLWARTMRLPLWAALVGAIAFAVHPVSVAALASVDGFGGVLTAAAVWFLCWILYVCRDRPWLALAITIPIYIFASGFKEYVFGFAPMACATALLFYRRPVRWALINGVAVGAVTAGILGMRHFLVRLSAMSDEALPQRSFSVMRVITNTFMGVGAALYPGNTISYFTGEGSGRLVVVAGGLALTLAILAIALVLVRPSTIHGSDGEPTREPTPARWLLFIAFLTLGALFPANVAMRVSEMYLLALALGVGLGFAWAAVAISRATPALRMVASVAIAVWIGWAATSTHAKVAEEKRSGELSWAIAQFLSRTLPPTMNQKVAILYDADAARRAGGYSVFRVPRAGLVTPNVLDYVRPGYRGWLTNLAVDAAGPAPDLSPYDIVIAWDLDHSTGRYVRPASLAAPDAAPPSTLPASQP